ncbi:DUF1206 domain-containing protein [Segetibacter sp. 3557_3]|uniref:DUF1206 domain-containing protein n=1 Tax=Segetibacter sp. 3557_3 TaxID=2547429 RepID=UPI0010590B12|nr:DUF1206 domain-containing protein [Segetibacter sp. 3557_3]TDH24167.1 DUF1206 domain-containing protein [Segetibacter sp. 3557_3]
MGNIAQQSSSLKRIAQAGLISKGLVYCLLGILAFMAAFQVGGQSTKNTDKEGVLNLVYKQTGGQILLGLLAIGLACYTIWRLIQAFSDTEHKGSKPKGLAARARYLFSGLVYGSLAIYAIKMTINASSGSGGKSGNESMAGDILSKPLGQWLLGIAAAIIIGVGIYQIYYAISEKYRKHVENVGGTTHAKILLNAGKIGYIARGIVWLVIGWLFANAALHSNASEAGDTSKAFGFLANADYGSFLLGGVGVGLICYGVFTFIRARYERLG